jgi:site-specific recombinase XerD
LLLRVLSEKKRGRIREARVPIYSQTLRLLDGYQATRWDSNEALFLNCYSKRLGPSGISQLVKRALTMAGIQAPKGCRNVLRHARASHLRLQGVPLEDVRQLLRNERLETSLIYSHIGVSDLAKRIPEPVLLSAEVASAA